MKIKVTQVVEDGDEWLQCECFDDTWRPFIPPYVTRLDELERVLGEAIIERDEYITELDTQCCKLRERADTIELVVPQCLRYCVIVVAAFFAGVLLGGMVYGG